MAKGIRFGLTAVIAAAIIGLTSGCSRPTPHESTYETDINNKYSWNGVGPGMEFWEFIGEQEDVSHKRQIMTFPLLPTKKELKDKYGTKYLDEISKHVATHRDLIAREFPLSQLTEEQQGFLESGDLSGFFGTFDRANPEHKKLIDRITLAFETQQSIITAGDNSGMMADGASSDIEGIREIMIQELIVGYIIGKDAESVKKYHIDHRPQDRYLLERNLDGLLRTFLQTKTKAEIEADQMQLATDALKYLKTFKTGGVPEYNDNKEFIGFKGGYTIEEEWGIQILNVGPRRIRAPSYVLEAGPMGDEILSTAKGEYDVAKSEQERRRSKLKSIANIIENVGDNPAAAKFLTSQAAADFITGLGADNIGELNITQGLRTETQMTYQSATKTAIKK